ncbi:MAG: low specificity L-threonine aldolase [Gammaproteobacteria bacterium]|nr:low specificity L-threonine aldolase [Gammaproteobacteria bacterium]
MAEKSEQFASDNYAGICDSAWRAMAQANLGHAQAYGDDPWTARAADRLRELFDSDCEIFFVFNGTAGNALALASLCSSYHGIICHETAHVEPDECGAPEFFSNGAKLLTAAGVHGKLTPEAITAVARKRTDLHYPKPKVVTITQATELGTLYTIDELRQIGTAARENGLRLHMDGARFANAVAALGCTPREITVDCGVDLLCFGGTKNGMAVGDAVIFFNRALAEDFEWRCKQAGQLASKMRFISAPWIAMLEDGSWLENARHANDSAAALERGLRGIPGVRIMFPRQINSLFVSMPEAALAELRQRGWHFYTFIGVGGARFMCSWDTTPASIERLIEETATAVANAI